MAVGNRARFEIFKRDSFTCCYCGRRPPAVVLEVDHIVAVASGGSDNESNLTTSCFECNRGKSDKSLAERIVVDVQVRNLELENEKLEQLRGLNEQQIELRAHEARIFKVISDIWIGYEAPSHVGIQEVSGPLRKAIERYIKLLPMADVAEAVEITCSRLQSSSYTDKVRYFSAICRNKINGYVPPRHGEYEA